MKKLAVIAALLFAVNASADTHTTSYSIDPAASSIAWKGSKKTGSFHHGNISIKDGAIEADKKGNITAGNFTIDMKTISNEDLKKDPGMQKKLIGHLSSADFFNVEKHPTATFKIASVTKKGKDHIIKGDLTILGKTNAIEFPAKVTSTKDAITGEAKFKIDRTKWDIKYGSGNFFKELTADKIINNEIEFDLKLTAKPAVAKTAQK